MSPQNSSQREDMLISVDITTEMLLCRYSVQFVASNLKFQIRQLFRLYFAVLIILLENMLPVVLFLVMIGGDSSKFVYFVNLFLSIYRLFYYDIMCLMTANI